MDRTECSGIFLFNIVVYKPQVDSRSDITPCLEDLQLVCQISWNHLETSSPISTKVSALLGLFFVHIGGIQETSCCNSSKLILIVVWITEPLHLVPSQDVHFFYMRFD